ncbi:hypothetical protein OROHE_006624 [Orobanche hederae]
MALNLSLFPWLITLLALLALFFIKSLLKLKKGSSKSKPHPPGPPGRPLVGNIFDLGEVPHQTFHKLQARYGPVVRLKLGATNTVVVQSAEAAAELFRTCDLPFADRKAPDSLTALGYNRGSVAIGAYGDYWRKLRRICATEFLVRKRVHETFHVRQKSVGEMIEWIKKDVEKSREKGGTGEIQLDRFLFVAAFNTVGNLLLTETTMDKTSDFLEVFSLFLEWCGKPNLADFFPFLKWIDPQGIRRNTAKYLDRLIGFASGIVRERIRQRELGMEKERNDFLDALLDEGEVDDNGSDKLSLKNITIVLLEMFLGGTETTSTTIEWGMTELLRHPNSMREIQDEIDRVVGRARKVEENDITHMPYLQATVKEILRLHPALQMLLPRNSMQDTEFMGYFVPKNTQILVNAWAIHRDPAAWPDPLSFKPERFLESDIDYKGQHFQMIPFGSGRRSCLGLTLGHRMVSLTIASLLQTFEWRLADGTESDMREMVGLTLRKKVPLKVIPCIRE